MNRLDGFASLPHYLTHCAAVWRALPPTRRGRFWVTTRTLRDMASTAGIPAAVARRPPHGRTPILVAGWVDYRATAPRPVVLVEHGAGQPYQGVVHRSHPGGPQRGRVGLYLCPNQDVADRNLATYPHATAAVVGPAHLDRWHRAKNRATNRADQPLQRANGPIVISWHFDSQVAPEATSAWPHFGPPALEQLRDHLHRRLHGHAHPRILDRMSATYRALDIPIIEHFDQVLDTAALYLCDNSSTMFEAASCGIPVVALNAPWYRRDVHHGLRFWSHVPGPQVDHPTQLLPVVDAVLADPGPALASGQAAAAACYVACDGHSAHRAASAVSEWLDRQPSGADP